MELEEQFAQGATFPHVQQHDADRPHPALEAVSRWMERIAEKEVERITAKHQRYQERQGYVPRWVERGMGERFSHAERLEHRVQMMLGIFSAKGMLPLEFKPAHSVGDLLTQHLDELEQETERKGGVMQLLIDHFAKVYKIDPPLAA